MLDRWVRSLDDEEFLEIVPLLRRGFGTFAPAERGNLLRAARTLSGAPTAPADPGLDLSRAGRRAGHRQAAAAGASWPIADRQAR